MSKKCLKALISTLAAALVICITPALGLAADRSCAQNQNNWSNYLQNSVQNRSQSAASFLNALQQWGNSTRNTNQQSNTNQSANNNFTTNYKTNAYGGKTITITPSYKNNTSRFCFKGICPGASCPGSNCPDKNCVNGNCSQNNCPNGNCNDNNNCPNGNCNDNNNCPNDNCDDNNNCPNGNCDNNNNCPNGNCDDNNNCPNGNCDNNNDCPNGNCGGNQGGEDEQPNQPSQPDDDEPVVGSDAQQVAQLVNQERQAAGLDAVTLDANLSAAANVRAKEIAQKFSHNRPNGSSCFTVLGEMGISYGTAEENIAAGQKSPAAVMKSWMNSAGHRSNILSSDVNKIGVGVYTDANGQINWVQLFTD